MEEEEEEGREYFRLYLVPPGSGIKCPFIHIKHCSLFFCVSASSPEEGVTVVTVEGGRGELPCDIAAPTPGDSVYLVLWYRKDSAGTPIYR